MRPSGPYTCAASPSSYGFPVTACTISPTAMLSEFEYSYLEPGGKASGSSFTYSSSCSGGGATVSEAPTACWKAGLFEKSGRPLV